MAKIKSVAQAIGIIGKEVEKMGRDEKEEKDVRRKERYCIECNAEVSHIGAYFCKMCAMSFYREPNKGGIDDE